MNRNSWIFCFVVALAINLIGIISKDETAQSLSKPFLVPLLAGYFIVTTPTAITTFRTWAILALFFSWVGDVLLIFQGRKEIFFLLGLASFLLAHICYIIFFNLARSREGIPGKWWLLLIVVVYYSLLISLLSPYLGDMKIPVKVYAVVVNFMFMLAMHLYFITFRRAGLLIMFGALCFIISDTLLAINKFYYPFPSAGFIIMLSYGLAQWLIVEGMSRYLNSIVKR